MAKKLSIKAYIGMLEFMALTTAFLIILCPISLMVKGLSSYWIITGLIALLIAYLSSKWFMIKQELTSKAILAMGERISNQWGK